MHPTIWPYAEVVKVLLMCIHTQSEFNRISSTRISLGPLRERIPPNLFPTFWRVRSGECAMIHPESYIYIYTYITYTVCRTTQLHIQYILGVHHTFGSPFWLQYIYIYMLFIAFFYFQQGHIQQNDAGFTHRSWFYRLTARMIPTKPHRLEQNHYLPQTTRTVKSGCSPATVLCYVACHFGTGLGHAHD